MLILGVNEMLPLIDEMTFLNSKGLLVDKVLVILAHANNRPLRKSEINCFQRLREFLQAAESALRKEEHSDIDDDYIYKEKGILELIKKSLGLGNRHNPHILWSTISILDDYCEMAMRKDQIILENNFLAQLSRRLHDFLMKISEYTAGRHREIIQSLTL